MSDTTIKDWRGTEIEVGDIILYAVKHSTSVEVNEAIVKEVGRKPRYSWLTDMGRDLDESDYVPYVAAEWQTSSYCYLPGRKVIISNERTIKNIVLTNFEGLTVVAKGNPPAWARIRKPVFGNADLSVQVSP